MREQPTVTTDRLVLRPFQPDDAEPLEHLGNDPEVISRTGRSEVPVPGTGLFWMENRLAWYEKGEAVDFAITLAETGEFVGIIGLGMEYPGDDAMQLGFWVGKEYWNRGYATEDALAVLPLGFSSLNLHRIFARHFISNPASGRVLEKIGMLYEGTLRESTKKNGVYESVACYAILRSDYNKA